jgi:hypothetical protein
MSTYRFEKLKMEWDLCDFGANFDLWFWNKTIIFTLFYWTTVILATQHEKNWSMFCNLTLHSFIISFNTIIDLNYHVLIDQIRTCTYFPLSQLILNRNYLTIRQGSAWDGMGRKKSSHGMGRFQILLRSIPSLAVELHINRIYLKKANSSQIYRFDQHYGMLYYFMSNFLVLFESNS